MRPAGRTAQSCKMSSRSRADLKPRRRAATRSAGNAGGIDLISGLSDDLLVRILHLLPDARDVVRTGALSHRWRGLWTGVAALRFDFCSRPMRLPGARAAAQRYLTFVNDALALRAAANESSVLQDLTISFDVSDLESRQFVPLAVEAARGWMRYAAQHELKSFILKLDLPCLWRKFGRRAGRPVMTLDETGSYAKMETLHLALARTELRLPSSVLLLASLVDLSLEGIHLPAGGGYLLSRLVSSACCPLLHKLRLASLDLAWKEDLLIEAVTLLELSLKRVGGLQFLELRTPSLRVLHIKHCLPLDGFTPSAPRLEYLKVGVQQPLHIDDVHGHLSSVGTIKIELFSHGIADHDRNAGTVCVLQCCRFSRCIEVSFEVVKSKYQTVDTISGRIPPLPHVTSLSVRIELTERHSSGPGVACLLAQCSNIKYLRLHLCYYLTESNKSELDLLCDNNLCHWKSHEFLLADLEEVEFKKLLGTECEFQFIQSILTKATGIQKVTFSFDQLYWPKDKKRAFKLMPPLDGGLWAACNDAKLSYKWRRYL